jgi:hypothetical protein
VLLEQFAQRRAGREQQLRHERLDLVEGDALHVARRARAPAREEVGRRADVRRMEERDQLIPVHGAKVLLVDDAEHVAQPAQLRVVELARNAPYAQHRAQANVPRAHERLRA